MDSEVLDSEPRNVADSNVSSDVSLLNQADQKRKRRRYRTLSKKLAYQYYTDRAVRALTTATTYWYIRPFALCVAFSTTYCLECGNLGHNAEQFSSPDVYCEDHGVSRENCIYKRFCCDKNFGPGALSRFYR
ncbi:hypothetical protein AVEN_152453-1 [Araneus ventricosus]|uniref:Uncharacterized protein n=1 Tax=Araneus ventricosus TaxID=182803 RepID=A0A4Y2SJ08_ARAVE|nr:hypothetical protein AVEN_152453-1 [Araneus ventricosus]